MTSLFPNALHVARREYLVRVRGRAFVITSVLLALSVVVVTLLPTLLQAAGAFGEPPRIAVVDEAGDLASDPAATLRATLAAGGAAPGASADGATVTDVDDRAEAEADVRGGELDGLLTISRDAAGALRFEYLGDAGPTSTTRLLVTQAAQQIAIADRLARTGISPAEWAQISAPAPFTTRAADPGAREGADYGAAILAAYVVVILTFMAILTYGNWVAQSVAEEKSNRVMELLITAATPRQLLTGKVLGSGAAGLTQYAVVALALVAGLALNGPVAAALGVAGGSFFTLPELEWWMPVVFAAFFLLGFTLYATLYAAAGSMVSRLEDVQQAVGPLILVSMAGYFVSFTALNDPAADWVATLSLVPFFSPYLIPARMLLTPVPGSDIVLALALLFVTLVAAIWIAARIYSAGVLLYGQRVGVRTVLRATRVAR